MVHRASRDPVESSPGRAAGPADPSRLSILPMERKHPRLERITFDPEKCGGKACIRGLRVTVESVVASLASGMTTEQILAEWPELEEQDIRQALTLAAWSVGEQVLEVA